MIDVLDHGYLKLIETWGSDERIVEAARMSTGKGFLGWGPDDVCAECRGNGKVTVTREVWDEEPLKERVSATSFRLVGGKSRREVVEEMCAVCRGGGSKPGDEKLLRYLWENAHATPFEMAGMVVEVQAPIFVFREWHRHRTQSYNEMSARYTPLPDVNYVPTVERLMLNSKTNKQAGTVKGAEELTPHAAEEFQRRLACRYREAEDTYRWALASGVPKELARVHLPVGRYSRMRASANLRNWLAFLTLRMAPNAQYEIRAYANGVGSLIAEAFPRTWVLAAPALGK